MRTQYAAGQATVIRGDARPLAGFYHSPAGEARDVPVVICPPLGYEALMTYRTCRHLAEHLARQGFHVLRFDYFGTGNSSGETTEAHDVCGDIAAAIVHVKQLSGASKICLFGLRAGALFAASAAEERTDIAALIMMASPQSGRALVRELRASQAMIAAPEFDAPEDRGRLHLVGFEFAAPLLAELEKIKLLDISFAGIKRILILEREDFSSGEKLLNHCTEAGTLVKQAVVVGYAEMMVPAEESQVPEHLPDLVSGWLTEFSLSTKETSEESSRRPIEALMSIDFENAELSEKAVRFGPLGSLFGVVTKSTEPRLRPPHAVLLLNVGANHHVGSGRIYVDVARKLAAQGALVLRFDLSGIGESRAADGKDENLLYDPDGVLDVAQAVEFLKQAYQVEKFVIAGVCLGAHVGFHALPTDSRIVGRILFNWSIFDLQPPVKKQSGDRIVFKSHRHYRSAVFNSATWRRVFRGDVAVFAVVRHFLRHYGLLGLSVIKRHLIQLQRTESSGVNVVETQMKSMLKAGIPVWLVYSSGDPALDAIHPYLGKDAAWVRGPKCFDMNIVAHADHAFTSPVAQRELSRLMMDFAAVTGCLTTRRELQQEVS